MDNSKIPPEKAAEMFGVSPEEQAAYTASREGIIQSRKPEAMAKRVAAEEIARQERKAIDDTVHLELTRQECDQLLQLINDAQNHSGISAERAELEDLYQKIVQFKNDAWDELEKPDRLSPGTTVQTTQPNLEERRQWTDEAWAAKKWGVRGTVLTHHDSHGLCYDVLHNDGTRASYDPTEIEVIE